MKFIKIYAASVRDMKQQAGRDLASREALTASLGRKNLSAPFRSEVSDAEFRALNFKRRIPNGEFRALNFKSGFGSNETGLRDAANS